MQHLGGTSAKYNDIPFLMDERELEIGVCEGKGGGGGILVRERGGILIYSKYIHFFGHLKWLSHEINPDF
jgi:hypothetical protein